MPDYTAIEYANAALLLIDLQTDFIDGATPVAGTAELLPRLADLIDAFRHVGRPVIHVIRYYKPGDSDADPIRRASIESGANIVAPGTPGAAIPSELTAGNKVVLDHDQLLAGNLQSIGPNEMIIYKPRWSAFYRTDLDTWLRENQINSVIVAGCNLPNCPRATLFDATERDYRAAVVTDAVSQVTPERVSDLRLIGVNLLTTHDITAALAMRADVPVNVPSLD